MSPDLVAFGETQVLTVTGENFYSQAEVSLNSANDVKIRRDFRVLIDATALGPSSIQAVSPTRLDVIAPSSLPEGMHSLTVVTPEGLSDTLLQAFSVRTNGGNATTGGITGSGGVSSMLGGTAGTGAASKGGSFPSGGTESTLGGMSNGSGASVNSGGSGSSVSTGGMPSGGSGGGMSTACASACQSNETCCGSVCVDLTRDIQHCGTCDSVCGVTDFCATAPVIACQPAVFLNVCLNAQVTSVDNGDALDTSANAVIRNGLTQQCTPAPQGQAVPQTNPLVLDQTTGKPLVGPGNLLLAAGGDAAGELVAYLNSRRITPIYHQGTAFRKSVDGTLVKMATNVTADHDVFVLQVVREPTNGTFILEAYGFHASGTTAAAWYFTNVMLPSLSSYTDAWYVYEWTDTINDNRPTNTSEFVLIQSGR